MQALAQVVPIIPRPKLLLAKVGLLGVYLMDPVALNQLLVARLAWIQVTMVPMAPVQMGSFPKTCPNPHQPVYLSKAFWKPREDSMSTTVDQVVDLASSTTKDMKWAYLGACQPHHSIP